MLDYDIMNVTKAKWGEMPMTKRERELAAQVKHLTSVINELVRRLDETTAKLNAAKETLNKSKYKGCPVSIDTI